MDITDIKARVRRGLFQVSYHAELEAEADNLKIGQLVEAILDGEILETYLDTGRGSSCLIVGYAGDVPLHIVCGLRADNVVVVTVYIPGLPKFADPWTRIR